MSLVIAVPAALAAAIAYGASTAVQHDAAQANAVEANAADARAAQAGAAKNSAAKAGAAKNGAAKDGAAKDGATKNGATKNGATKDGATKDGATKNGATKNGATNPRAEAGSDGPDCGRVSADGLLALLRDPRWLLSVGGDAIGLILQVVALSTGPVVLVQPLLVLAVAVALPVGWALGGPRPRRGDILAGAAVIVALAVFFVIVGDPGNGDRLVPRTAALTAAVTLLGGALTCLAVRGRSAPIRAVAFGAAAGTGFGVVGVLLNATATAVSDAGWAALRHQQGMVPLVAVIILGAAALVLTQVSFQIGALGASFPASEAAGPVAAVALGGFLLHENVPFTPWHALAYAVLLAVMVAGTIRLALGPRTVN